MQRSSSLHQLEQSVSKFYCFAHRSLWYGERITGDMIGWKPVRGFSRLVATEQILKTRRAL